MKHKSQLPKNRKTLQDWSLSEIQAIVESAKKYRGDARVSHVERSGISMGTFYRWRRDLAEGSTAPNAPRPKSRQHSPEERAKVVNELSGRPGQAREVARKHGINVATLYAWRKQGQNLFAMKPTILTDAYKQPQQPEATPQTPAEAKQPEAADTCCNRLAAALEKLAQLLRSP